MAVTNEAGLSPQAPPQSQDPSSWYHSIGSRNMSTVTQKSPQYFHESPEQNGSSAAPGKVIVSGQQKTESASSKNGQNERASKKTDEMTDFMDDLTLSSPEERSRSSSRSSCSRRSSSRSSSRSSYSSRSSSSTSSSSRSWSRSRSRSRSRPKRNCSRRNRRYSRSYSRSRSRSRSYRYRERYHPRYYSRRYHRSPPRYRSRSRSPRRSYYRRSYSRSRSRSRRYYGFGRTIYPEAYRSWRSRSRSRSRSRTPLRLTEKEKRELLEIAKANAAKTFGTNIVLPASLKIATKSKEMETGKPNDNSIETEQSRKQIEDGKKGTETVSAVKGIACSPDKTVARPVATKPTNLPFKETAGSPGREEKRESPSGQWIPVKNEENVVFHNFSPKSTSFRAR